MANPDLAPTSHSPIIEAVVFELDAVLADEHRPRSFPSSIALVRALRRQGVVTAVKQDALVVPKEAIFSYAQTSQPSVVTIDSTTHTTRVVPVTVGLQSAQYVEIASGLEEGQLVATSGLPNLTDGALVAPQVG